MNKKKKTHFTLLSFILYLFFVNFNKIISDETIPVSMKQIT